MGTLINPILDPFDKAAKAIAIAAAWLGGWLLLVLVLTVI